MPYIERPPHPALARFVKCVWCYESRGTSSPDRIVPDGRPELIVHFGAPYREIADAGSRLQPSALFAGQLTRPLQVQAGGPSVVIGVRFHPDGARGFIRQPLRDTTDLRVPVPGLTFGALNDNGAGARMDAVERAVIERMGACPIEEDPVVRRIVDAIEHHVGEADLDALIAREAIGRRQLERRFGDRVGVGPALLASIFRFRRVFDVIEHDARRPWTDAAMAAGFYDQSHFIREFRRFVGCTPTEFQAGRSGLASALVGA